MPDLSHWQPADYIAVITALGTFASAILAGWAKIAASKAAAQSSANSDKIDNVHKTINGRVEELTTLKAEKLVSDASQSSTPKAP